MTPAATTAKQGRVPDDVVTAVKERSDIVQIVNDYTTLKRAGSAMKGLCVFHDEKTPSFTVHPTTKTWHCFGCGEGGDAIEFIRRTESFDFRGAVQFLADRLGIVFEDSTDETATEEQQNRKTTSAATAAAAKYFSGSLDSPEAEGARAYLTNRNFTREHAAHFGCGYAPLNGNALITHLRSEGFTIENLETAGLITRNKRGTVTTPFRGRLTWTIYDAFNKPIGFGARRLRDDDTREPKFINTSDTPIYKKSNVLYGYNLARKKITSTATVAVVEGYTDVMACQLAGIDVAVATCGTAFTPEHLAMLRRVIGENGEIVFAWDDDAAGHKATLSVYDMSKETVKRLSSFPSMEGADPEDYRRQHGDAALAKLFASRRTLLSTVIDATLRNLPTQTPEDRSSALDQACALLRHVNDTLVRREYAQQIASRLGFPEADVFHRVGVSATPSQPKAQAPDSPSAGETEKEIIRVLLHYRRLAVEYAEECSWLMTMAAAQGILQGIAAAAKEEVDTTWGAHVLSHCDPSVQGPVTALLSQGISMTEELAAAHTQELLDRLVSARHDQDQQAHLAALTNAADEEQRDVALRALIAGAQR